MPLKTDIADSNLVTPVSILKEQAELLGQKTRNLIQGEVKTQTTGDMFTDSFYFVAPTIGYRYELFRVSHYVSFYPLVVTYKNANTSLHSEPEFKEKLKEIFSGQHSLNIVHSILAQVRS